jgi:FixJ family two-component response regulator
LSTERSLPRPQPAAPDVDEQAALVAIVDDDESIRIALHRLVRSAGYSVDVFASATDFLGSLSLRTPSCLLLDLQLPGMTGIELLQRFAELDNAPPVVVITGSDDQCLLDQCLALGAKQYLRKPVDCDKLLEAISEILRDTAGGSSEDLIAWSRPSRLR